MSKEVSNIKTIIGKMTEDVSQEEVVEVSSITPNAPTLSFNSNGVMGSMNTDSDDRKIEKIVVPQNLENTKIAVFSTRNMYAEGPGKLHIGYNIISKRHVDFWLSMNGVRLATPEEVMEAFT
jgi:hypothetical protein